MKRNYIQLVRKFSLLASVALFSNTMLGQSTVFYDDFSNRDAVTIGGVPEITYTTGGSGLISTSLNALKISGPETVAYGQEFMIGSSSSFIASPLNSNSNEIIWSFNMRTAKSSSSYGFDTDGTTSNNGLAVILALNNTDPTALTASGYAVALRKNSGNTNSVSLVRFAGGLTANANVTTIIEPSSDLGAYNNYVSVKIVYAPLTNSWQLYYRDDETTAGVDPLSGTLTQVGSDVVDNTYTTESAYTNFGWFFNHGTNSISNCKGNFDNFRVQLNLLVTFTTEWPKAENSTSVGFTAKVNANVAGTSYVVVVPTGATAPSSAQVVAGTDAADAAAVNGSIACATGLTEYTTEITGLSASTDYDTYFVAKDASGNNLQAVPTKVSFSTSVATSLNSVNALANAYVSNGKLVVLQAAEVYNSIGLKVATVNAKSELSLKSGIYIVKTKGSVQKIML